MLECIICGQQGLPILVIAEKDRVTKREGPPGSRSRYLEAATPREQLAKEQTASCSINWANREATLHTPLRAGLSAIPNKLVAKILSNDYDNLAELPPAKGKGRPMLQSLEGAINIVQAADLIQARKIMPDFAT